MEKIGKDIEKLIKILGLEKKQDNLLKQSNNKEIVKETITKEDRIEQIKRDINRHKYELTQDKTKNHKAMKKTIEETITRLETELKGLGVETETEKEPTLKQTEQADTQKEKELTGPETQAKTETEQTRQKYIEYIKNNNIIKNETKEINKKISVLINKKKETKDKKLKKTIDKDIEDLKEKKNKIETEKNYNEFIKNNSINKLEVYKEPETKPSEYDIKRIKEHTETYFNFIENDSFLNDESTLQKEPNLKEILKNVKINRNTVFIELDKFKNKEVKQYLINQFKNETEIELGELKYKEDYQKETEQTKETYFNFIENDSFLNDKSTLQKEPRLKEILKDATIELNKVGIQLDRFKNKEVKNYIKIQLGKETDIKLEVLKYNDLSNLDKEVEQKENKKKKTLQKKENETKQAKEPIKYKPITEKSSLKDKIIALENIIKSQKNKLETENDLTETEKDELKFNIEKNELVLKQYQEQKAKEHIEKNNFEIQTETEQLNKIEKLQLKFYVNWKEKRDKESKEFNKQKATEQNKKEQHKRLELLKTELREIEKELKEIKPFFKDKADYEKILNDIETEFKTLTKSMPRIKSLGETALIPHTIGDFYNHKFNILKTEQGLQNGDFRVKDQKTEKFLDTLLGTTFKTMKANNIKGVTQVNRTNFNKVSRQFTEDFINAINLAINKKKHYKEDDIAIEFEAIGKELNEIFKIRGKRFNPIEIFKIYSNIEVTRFKTDQNGDQIRIISKPFIVTQRTESNYIIENLSQKMDITEISSVNIRLDLYYVKDIIKKGKNYFHSVKDNKKIVYQYLRKQNKKEPNLFKNDLQIETRENQQKNDINKQSDYSSDLIDLIHKEINIFEIKAKKIKDKEKPSKPEKEILNNFYNGVLKVDRKNFNCFIPDNNFNLRKRNNEFYYTNLKENETKNFDNKEKFFTNNINKAIELNNEAHEQNRKKNNILYPEHLSRIKPETEITNKFLIFKFIHSVETSKIFNLNR